MNDYSAQWHAENPNPPLYKNVLVDIEGYHARCLVCLSHEGIDRFRPDEFKTPIPPQDPEGVWLCNHCREEQYLVIKTWGFERWFVHTDRYCGKFLGVMPDRHCSLHCHKLKDETFYIQEGVIRLYYGMNTDALECGVLTKGMSFRIPPGMWHSFEGIERSVIVEVSTPHLESDSYRASLSSKGYPERYL